MPRIRNVKPDIFVDDDLCGQCSFPARWLYVALFCQADKAGRLEDRPAKIKMTCLPYDDVDVEALLSELARGRFIVRYQANQHNYIQIRTWAKHQRPHHTETESVIPSPTVTCENNGYQTVTGTLERGENPLGKEKGKDLGKEKETENVDALKRDPQTGYVVGSAQARPSSRQGLMSGAPASSAFSCAAFSVPGFLHRELCGKLSTAGVDNPDASLKAWYGRLRDEQQGQETPSDNLKWIRSKFDAWRGVSSRHATNRTADNDAEAEKFLSRLMGGVA